MNFEDMKLHEIAAELKKHVLDLAPQAWDLLKWVVRVEALQLLVPSVLAFLILPYVNIKYVWPLYKRGLEEYKSGGMFDDEGEGKVGISIFIMILSTAALIFASVCLLDVWNWVALFQPEIEIAHRVYEKVMSQ